MSRGMPADSPVPQRRQVAPPVDPNDALAADLAGGSAASNGRRPNPQAGEVVGDGKGRTFPCESCGADLVFHIGQQKQKCPYCGAEKELVFHDEAVVEEQDFEATLARLDEIKRAKSLAESKKKPKDPHGFDGPSEPRQAGENKDDLHEVRCASCAATVVFTGTLTSSECGYCGSPIQLDKVHDSVERIPVDGVLPFFVDDTKARGRLSTWVGSLWFAPNDFLARGVSGQFTGVYIPFFTFDSLTFTLWVGERGDHYYVTVYDGKEEKKERRTSWSRVGGEFQFFFDDVLILAAKDLPRTLVDSLSPWPLEKLIPYSAQVLAGFQARTYDIELKESFEAARKIMISELEAHIRKLIGGDEQRIESRKSQWSAITFKHILLPAWFLTYRYGEKTYRVVVNATTGEVQGERPYSVIKILLFIGMILAIIGAIYAGVQMMPR